MDARHRHVRHMAAAYLKELCGQQPRGPYYLAGECIGGIVAYEMAQQLTERGEAVALLAMLDTVCPQPGHPLHFAAGTIRKRLNQHWGWLQCKPRRDWWHRAAREVQAMIKSIGDDLGYGLWTGPGGDNPQRHRAYLRRFSRHYEQTLHRYQPKPYPGKITLLLSGDFPPSSPPARNWKGLALGGADLHEVKGTHATYIRDHAETIGTLLGHCISQARSSTPPGGV